MTRDGHTHSVHHMDAKRNRGGPGPFHCRPRGVGMRRGGWHRSATLATKAYAIRPYGENDMTLAADGRRRLDGTLDGSCGPDTEGPACECHVQARAHDRFAGYQANSAATGMEKPGTTGSPVNRSP